MNCKTVNHYIMIYTQSSLPNDKLNVLFEHIEQCEECREIFEIFNYVEDNQAIISSMCFDEAFNIEQTVMSKIKQMELKRSFIISSIYTLLSFILILITINYNFLSTISLYFSKLEEKAWAILVNINSSIMICINYLCDLYVNLLNFAIKIDKFILIYIIFVSILQIGIYLRIKQRNNDIVA